MTANQDGWLDRRAAVADHVASRALAGETVMLDLRTGMYHGLNPIAARFLEASTSMPTLAAAVTQLAKEYGQPAERIEQDLGAFVADLAERGLLVLHD